MKPTHFVGSSLADLKSFPADVRMDVGFALHQAEQGEKSLHATPLVGFKGAGVLEVISNSDGKTYRAVYTVTRLRYRTLLAAGLLVSAWSG